MKIIKTEQIGKSFLYILKSSDEPYTFDICFGGSKDKMVQVKNDFGMSRGDFVWNCYYPYMVLLDITLDEDDAYRLFEYYKDKVNGMGENEML